MKEGRSYSFCCQSPPHELSFTHIFRKGRFGKSMHAPPRSLHSGQAVNGRGYITAPHKWGFGPTYMYEIAPFMGRCY